MYNKGISLVILTSEKGKEILKKIKYKIKYFTKAIINANDGEMVPKIAIIVSYESLGFRSPEEYRQSLGLI